MSGGYEKVTRSGGNKPALTEQKLYVGNLVITKRSNNTVDEFYLHKDHQGSTTTITNKSGNVVQQFTYDPWGKQTAAYSHSLLNDYIAPAASKGYTGHEGIDNLNLIHMNGRIYDPTIGRFLQADPHIQAPTDTQSYNRYSYVLNNPMSFTDPSGYFFKKLYKALGKIDGRYHTHKYIFSKNQALANVVQVGLNYIPVFGQLASAHFAFDRAFYATGSLRSAFKSGVITYATGYILSEIGNHSWWGQAGSPQNIAANAIVGGISSELQGGSFGHGFIAAGVTASFKPMINDIGGDGSANSAIARGDVSGLNTYKIHRVVAAATIGGTSSAISGGKFTNGALTGAFIQMFNGETRNREQLMWVASSPEHAKIIVMMRNLAQDSANEYDINCSGVRCALPWIRGSGIHKLFADKVRSLGTNFYAEVSYKGGFPVTYGTTGSVRADAIYGPIASPEIVFELKTGWGWVSTGESRAYFENIPRGRDPALSVIKVN